MRTAKTAWKHIRRSPYQATAAVLTMFLTLLLAGVFFLASVTSVFVLQYFESKPQIVVFFTEKAGKTEADTLTTTLQATGKISSAVFVSKDEALVVYKEQNKNDPLLLEMVTADILPASLEISASDPKYLAELEPIISKAAGVEEVVYPKDVVDTLIQWTNGIRLVGGALAILLAVDAILIIMMIIGIKIANKREEIDILTLVGASSWYIRTPFLFEGSIYGMLGAVVAWATITTSVVWLRDFLLVFLGIVPTIQAILVLPASSPFLIASAGFLSILVSVGCILGLVGSFVATNRFLKF